jgi:DNA-binding GntR family transcriptional regulator
LLLKETVAATLREKIVSGVIEPGQVIVEGKWATQLGVAQGSVREALNILAAEGFVQKTHGRRARVMKLSREDVHQIYQVRSHLEALAARLVVERQADLSGIAAACADLREAVAAGDVKRIVEADLRFHLALCEQSGNHILLEHARRLLVPLFAFVLMRVYTNQQGSRLWLPTARLHSSILEVLRLGEPFVAEQYVLRVTSKFEMGAYDEWEAQASQPRTS